MCLLLNKLSNLKGGIRMSIKKKLSILFVALIVMALGVACTRETVEQVDENGKEFVINHDLGETVLNVKPERVVVFDYGILDALDKIGEDIVGLPKGSLPDYLNKYKDDKYEDVGTLQEPNFEKIYELNPDLIIISARQADLYDEFVDIAPTIYLSVLEGDFMPSFKKNMEILGRIFQKEDIMAEEVANIEEKIEALNKKAKDSGKTGLFLMANDGNLSVFGEDSRFGVLYKEFGVTPVDKNIDSSTHGQKISFEYLVEKDPDILYVMDRAVIAGGEISAKQVLNNDLIKSTTAYKEDKIIYLNSPVWYVATGGITATEKMIEDVDASLD